MNGRGDAEGRPERRSLRWLPALLLAALPFGHAAAQGTPLPDVAQVAAGGYHSCAITTAGTVKCWGENSSGQLGDGSTTSSPWPVDVAGLSDVVQVSAGDAHTCARTSAGRVLCWGANPSGQLGNGGTANQLVPVEVAGLSGVAQVSAGFSHTCAVTGGGAAWCWGHNGFGQLGNGGTTNASTPVNVSGLASGVTAISAGGYHSCARTADGIRCWGINDWGQLGNAEVGSSGSSSPVAVSGLAGATAVSAGQYFSCALLQSGGVRCWGANWYGEVGDGSTEIRTAPVDVPGLSGIVELSAGGYHVCARSGGGAATCWGGGWNGALGNGSLANRSEPVAVSGLGAGSITQIGAGSYHTCAVTPDAELVCWGSNANSQLGNGELVSRTTPTVVPDLDGIQALALGFRHSCALHGNGELACWGSNSQGQVGDGSQDNNRTSPTPISNSGAVTAVALGDDHSCAILAGGSVECWGGNQYGELGNGESGTIEPLPVAVAGLAQVVAVSAGWEHTCALTQSGGVKCWGHNGAFGQLGDGSGTDHATPVDVPGLASGVIAISSGIYHTCGVMQGGGVKCWGGNSYGQLGDGSTTYRTTPVDVPGVSGIVAISAGPYHTCALSSAGGVWCWGDNASGQLGTGDTTGRLVPTAVSGLPNGVAQLSSNGFHSCVTTQGGAVWCWGQNYDGELGTGNHAHAFQPVQVHGLDQGVAAVSVGGYHTCALGEDGGVKCWGFHGNGQLGLGGRDTTVPGYVLEPGSSDAGLASLETSLGLLMPEFSPEVTDYAVTVANAVTAISFTPTAAAEGASILVNDQPVASGQASPAIALTVGPNTILIDVIAPDGETKQIYTLTVLRLADLRVAAVGGERIGTAQGVRLRVSNASGTASGIAHLIVEDSPTRLAPLSSCTTDYANGVATISCSTPGGVTCSAAEGICEFAGGLAAGQSVDIFLAPSSSAPIRVGIHEGGMEAQGCTLSGTTCTGTSP